MRLWMACAHRCQWTTLTTYLGGESVAGDKLKETGNTHWQGTGSTNEIGFTGLPGGFRYPNGSFGNIGNGGSWGSSSVSSTDFGWARTLGNGSNVIRYNSLNVEGLSVRCLKD